MMTVLDSKWEDHFQEPFFVDMILTFHHLHRLLSNSFDIFFSRKKMQCFTAGSKLNNDNHPILEMVYICLYTIYFYDLWGFPQLSAGLPEPPGILSQEEPCFVHPFAH